MDCVHQLIPSSRDARRFCCITYLLTYVTLCLGADQTAATLPLDAMNHDSISTELCCGSSTGSTLSRVVNLFYGEGFPCQSGMICCKTMSACPPPLTRIADDIRNDLQYTVPLFWTTPFDLLENSTWDFCQMSLDILKHLIVDDSKREMLGNRVLNTDGDGNRDAFLASRRKENIEAMDADLCHCFSTPEILISPSKLDWGSNYLHVPSFALLTITNTCNHSILTIYEISSTNSQFFAYNFSEISVDPGKYVTLPVVFLPIWLGLSSAQMVMETSFGGFLIHAQGLTVKSPYKIEPLIGLILSSSRKVRAKLSIYNPFDYVIIVNEALAWSSSISDDLMLFTHDICGEGTYNTTGIVHYSHFDDTCIPKNDQLNVPASICASARFMDKESLVHVNGHISGALCRHFQNSDERNWSDLARVPLEGKIEKVAYYSPNGLVYVSVEVLSSCRSSKPSSFILSLRNDASHLLSLVEVNEVGGSAELFQVHSWEGLLLYPGATTDIAFVTHTSIDPVPSPEKINEMSSGCKLQILTNDSVGSLVEIPCQDLILHSCNYYQINSSLDISGSSFLEATFQVEVTELSNTMTGLLSNILHVPTPFEVSGIKETGEVVLRRWRSRGTSEDMTILKESHIIFPAVHVGDHSSKLVTISNPSQYPVIIQLILNPRSVVRKCQDLTALLTNPSIEDVDHTDGIRDIFLLSDSATTEVHLPPFGKAFLGPISFRPSSSCEWTSTAYLRNNLSGVEVLYIHGFGGSPVLIFLEGSHPVRSLEFKLNAPISSAVSWFKLLGRKNQESICNQSLLKELLAKNIGNLPLEVRNIDVSGNGCGTDGFLIHTCKGFSLAPGESKRFLISFQADYSTSVVRSELVLGLAVGILVVPMTATLPHELLNICGKPCSGVLWKILIVVTIFVSLMILFDCIQNPKILESECGNQSAKCGLGLSVEKIVCLRDDHVSAEQEAATKLMVKMGKKRSRGKRTGVPLGLVEKLEALCGESSKFVPLSPTSPLMLSSTSEKIPEPADCSSECHSPAVINKVEYEEIGNLTVKTNANRRRKRRAYGNSMIKGKIDTSSSQSGNSTPSSPLSPLVSLSHKKTPLSPDNEQFSDYSTLRKSTQESRRETILKKESTPKLWGTEELGYYGNASSHLSKEQPSFLKKTSARPALLPSATFPAAGWRSSGTIASSTMTPLARAPGYQVRKDKLKDDISIEEKSDGKEDFTYDIWGNHFPGLNMMDKSVKTLTKALDDESLSFFSRDFQV